MDRDPRVRIRPVGVYVPPQLDDAWVDLDGVHLPHSFGEQYRDVIARAGTQYQRLPNGTPEPTMRNPVSLQDRAAENIRSDDFVHVERDLVQSPVRLDPEVWPLLRALRAQGVIGAVHLGIVGHENDREHDDGCDDV